MKINLSRKYLLLYLFLTIIPFSTWAAEDLTEQPSNENITLHEFLSSRGYVSLLLQKTIVGHFEAHVLVNGKKARFLIDTGASNTVVDHKSAAQYTLLIEDSNEAAGGGLGTSTQSVSTCIIILSKPPALPGDSQGLTVPPIKESLPNVNRPKLTERKTLNGNLAKFKP